MSSIKTTQIDGDISVGRNVALGGKATVAGSVTIGHNLKVSGWLEAPNIKDVNKGIFATLTDLQTAYPEPRDGWLAGVGTSSPFTAYIGDDGEWSATGGTIAITIDLSDYVSKEDYDDLEDDVEDLADKVPITLWPEKTPDETVSGHYIDGSWPNPMSYSNTGVITEGNYDTFFFEVEAGEVWHVKNTRSVTSSSSTAVWAVYNANTVEACDHSTLVDVSSSRLSTSYDSDVTIASGGTILAVAKWRGDATNAADIVKLTKKTVTDPATLCPTHDSRIEALESGGSVSVGILQTASSTKSNYCIHFQSPDDGHIGDLEASSYYDVLAFDVSDGGTWRIRHEHAASLNQSVLTWAIYSNTSVDSCSVSNLLLKGGKIRSSNTVDDTVVIPSVGKLLLMTRYKGGTGYAEDEIAVSKIVQKTSGEAYGILDVRIKSLENEEHTSMRVNRNGDSVVVCWNDGNGTELVYDFGRCFNTGSSSTGGAINNTLGLQKVGYRRVGRVLPVASNAGITSLCTQASSDMIGPVQIDGLFVGGAHNYKVDDSHYYKTSESVGDSWYSVKADGSALADGSDKYCRVVELVAKNTVKCLQSGSLVDCMTETITMTVEENRVKVHVSHAYYTFSNDGFTDGHKITLYYGMQSMFGARATTQILTPDGKFPRLTAESGASDFTIGSYPNFNRFIQRNNDGWCQSAWVNPAVGIGDHSKLTGADDVIFKDGGSNKFYHVLFPSRTSAAGAAITSGMTYEWEGVYSWAEDKGPSIAADLTNQRI